MIEAWLAPWLSLIPAAAPPGVALGGARQPPPSSPAPAMPLAILSSGLLPPPAQIPGDPDTWRPAPLTDAQRIPSIEGVRLLPPDQIHRQHRAVLRIGGVLAHVPFSRGPDGRIEVDMRGWPNPERWEWTLRHNILLLFPLHRFDGTLKHLPRAEPASHTTTTPVAARSSPLIPAGQTPAKRRAFRLGGVLFPY